MIRKIFEEDEGSIKILKILDLSITIEQYQKIYKHA